VTEHKYGSEVVQLICNLALMTGKLGRLGSALLPLRGQNNVQGSSDMGALPDTFTGYQHVEDEEVAQRFERRWGVKMKRERGLKIPEMFDAAVAGDLKAMWIFGEDVAQTDPNTTHVIHALESLEFLVCQEIFQTETSKYADVILPASAFLEKEGTFTNAERRVQHVKPAILPPVAGGRWPVAAGRGRDRLADPLHGPLRARERPRAPDGAAVQAAGQRGERRVPARARHRPAPAALQRGHHDAAHGQP
jgi:formate dehydrogenase major subunit